MKERIGDQVQLGLAEGWNVQPVDDDHTAIVFVVGRQRPGAVLENEALSPFIGRLIHEAVKFGQSRSPRAEDGETIYARLIPVIAMSADPGRAETEAILTLRFGNLTLSFAVDVAMLHGMCANLPSQLGPRGPQASH